MEEEELPSSEWKEKAIREWWALQGKLDLKLQEERREAAAQGQRRSSRQEGADTGERDRRGGVSVECQAWQEAALIAKGDLEMPCLRSGRRATQEPTDEEVHIVATAVGAEEGRRTLGKRDLEGGEQRRSEGKVSREEEEG